MPSAFVYLPDDEPDSQEFSGHRFYLKARHCTEFREYDPLKTEADLKSAEFNEDGSPSGITYLRWPGVAPADVARFVAEKHAPWGTVVVDGPDDEIGIVKANRQYLIGTLEWARTQIVESANKNKPLSDAGLQFVDSAEAKKAKAWITANSQALSASNLI